MSQSAAMEQIVDMGMCSICMNEFDGEFLLKTNSSYSAPHKYILTATNHFFSLIALFTIVLLLRSNLYIFLSHITRSRLAAAQQSDAFYVLDNGFLYLFNVTHYAATRTVSSPKSRPLYAYFYLCICLFLCLDSACLCNLFGKVFPCFAIFPITIVI